MVFETAILKENHITYHHYWFFKMKAGEILNILTGVNELMYVFYNIYVL